MRFAPLDLRIARSLAASGPGRRFVGTIQKPPFLKRSEAMIAKMGLRVLDERAVIGTFLLNCQLPTRESG